MDARAPEAPPARLALVFHAPTVARVEVVYRPAAGRLLRAIAAALVCLAAVPLLAWIPPHYPWAIAAAVAALIWPYRCWARRYRVVSFAGFCPRCGHALELPRGAKIDLPHTLTCLGCHFDPVLEVVRIRAPGAARTPEPLRVEHRSPECAGEWRLERGGFALACSVCGVRHCATPAARRAADSENRRSELLRELTTEGGFLL